MEMWTEKELVEVTKCLDLEYPSLLYYDSCRIDVVENNIIKTLN
jgi:hypothetical protein